MVYVFKYLFLVYINTTDQATDLTDYFIPRSVMANRQEIGEKLCASSKLVDETSESPPLSELPPEFEVSSPCVKKRKTENDPSDFQTPEEDRQNIRSKEILDQQTFKNLSSISQESAIYYTGFTKKMCECLINIISPHVGNTGKLTIYQEFFLTLMKLKHNFDDTDLAYRFNIDRRTASRVFGKWLNLLYYKFKNLIWWPTKAGLLANIPPDFLDTFGRKVVIIIECFEVYCERSGNLSELVQTWSSYKHPNTIKFLIGITPQGFISFISDGYTGRSSDTFITKHCGILDNLLPGDIVLTDRGFHIREVQVVQPALEETGKHQLNPYEVENTRGIANVRILVERLIGHIRQTYKILHDVIPMSILYEKDSNNNTTIDKIATVCCALININKKII